MRAPGGRWAAAAWTAGSMNGLIMVGGRKGDAGALVATILNGWVGEKDRGGRWGFWVEIMMRVLSKKLFSIMPSSVVNAFDGVWMSMKFSISSFSLSRMIILPLVFALALFRCSELGFKDCSFQLDSRKFGSIRVIRHERDLSPTSDEKGEDDENEKEKERLTVEQE